MWKETFQLKQRSGFWSAIPLAGIFTVLGILLLFVQPLIGIFLILFDLGTPVLIRYFTTDLTIVCTTDGFSVQMEHRRKGRTYAEYEWSEITGTYYRQRVHRGRDNVRRAVGYFAVETSRGRAFEIDERFYRFERLIEVFNMMTPQLSYVWVKQSGYTFSIESADSSGSHYIKVDRAEVATTIQQADQDSWEPS